jgi:hypothetical protein
MAMNAWVAEAMERVVGRAEKAEGKVRVKGEGEGTGKKEERQEVEKERKEGKEEVWKPGYCEGCGHEKHKHRGFGMACQEERCMCGGYE